ncbi:hypothetical protein DYQ86_14710 [Acidobacteria bacterium AB60]|nr:hypothetical protein DYQ86_14710 [Acidobacteria bacterium AB60]
MLMSMQQLASAAPVESSPGFASLLADLTLPPKKPVQRDPCGRDPDGLAPDTLEPDCLTLSYEQALRRQPSAKTAEDAAPACLATPAAERAGAGAPRAAKTRRSASITVRLSVEESEQLHLRAAEAGLTVSAYLRSCALEVETLRAEVKSTLAQLRSAPAPQPAHRAAPRRWTLPWQRLFRKGS